MALMSYALIAETVSFREGKYVEAVNLYTYRDGNVTYTQNKTVVSYKDGKKIVKNDNNLTIYDEENKVLTVINLTERPEIELYFSLTKALFQKDFDLLKENFELKQTDAKTFKFIPKDDTAKFIDKLELALDKEEKVKVLTLEFRNGDKTKIEAK